MAVPSVARGSSSPESEQFLGEAWRRTTQLSIEPTERSARVEVDEIRSTGT